MQSPMNTELPNIVQQLIAEKDLNTAYIENLAQQARFEKSSLLKLLIQQQLLNDADISQAFSHLYQLRMVDLSQINIDASVQLLSMEQLLEWQLLPLNQHMNHLDIAVADPEQLAHLEKVRLATGLNPNPVIVAYSELQAYFLHLQQQARKKRGAGGLRVSSNTRQQAYVLNSQLLQRFKRDDHAISQFVSYMLEHAIEQHVSDIHIEPYESIFRIRYRMDGVLTVVATPPKETVPQLVSRLKVMARLNSSERRIPQDGNIHFDVQDKKIDFRINTLPTLHGEKVVLRLLDSSNVQMNIDQLGFIEQQKKIYLKALEKPEGMIIVTGPTGSGKTITLYTGLSILNQPEKNLSTIEDPVEIQLAGINQVNINPKVGLSFSTALKAFLRQDPDIIMLGEIRDIETAEIAIKAAQTGHLVLSTLHTNSAPETLTRLLNMGIPAFNIASSVSLVIAQRLARRLCSCKQIAEISSKRLRYYGFQPEELQQLTIYQPAGCAKCSQGYKGRVGIYQVMPLSETMRHIIITEAGALELAAQAKIEGILNLREAGLHHVRAGLTSVEEIDRVTQG